MIKTENGVFYLTAGETCYIFKTADRGALETLYFGKRVEFEDNLAALGFYDFREPENLFGDIYRGGKKLAAEFVETDAKILDEKPQTGAPALVGGKTLNVSFDCESEKLRAELYVTPYPRGGFSRRVVLINNGSKPVSVKTKFPCAVVVGNNDIISLSGGAVKRTSCGLKASGGSGNFVIVASDSANESYGDAYGFLCTFGDGELYAEQSGGSTKAVCFGGEQITVGAGEAYSAPEVLAAYSYNGIGGLSRVFHDILRESIGDKYIGERRPTVLFCPEMSEKKMCEAAAAASELGLDVFAVNGGKASSSALGKIYDACKAAGITFGIKITPSEIAKNSAAYVSGLTEIKSGMYAVDFKNAKFLNDYIAALEEVIRKNGVEYLMLDVPNGEQPFAHGMYRLRAELVARFPDLLIDFGMAPPEMRYGQSLCYPPCIMRCVVEYEQTSFKSNFDNATFGCLGYALDPLELSVDTKRAVRAQIFSYQDDAPTVMLGDLYRLQGTDGERCLMAVTKDKSKAYVVCMPSANPSRVRLKGLDEHNLYHVRELGKTFSGAALSSCGIAVPPSVGGNGTFVLHLRQVADYDMG